MSTQIIEQAIREKRLLSFTYTQLPRIVEPHILGWQDGRLGILGYQVRGSSSHGTLPDWRRFYLDDIRNLVLLDERFPGRRPVSGPHSSWDSTILIVD
ncbi:WYL domain-containing protein [Ralstonia pseudosolanacearum]